MLIKIFIHSGSIINCYSLQIVTLQLGVIVASDTEFLISKQLKTKFKAEHFSLFDSYNFILFAVLLILVYTIKSVYRKRKLSFIDTLIGIGWFNHKYCWYFRAIPNIYRNVYYIHNWCTIFLLIIFSPYLLGEKVKRKIGKPCKIKCGVQYYLERGDIPFEDLIRQAKKEIVFVSLSHEYIQLYEQKILSQAIVNRGVKVTVLVLDPFSDLIPHKEHVFGIGNFGDGDLSKEG